MDTSNKHMMITTYMNAFRLFANVLLDLRHGLDRGKLPANIINPLLASIGEERREIEVGDNRRRPVQLPPHIVLLWLRHMGCPELRRQTTDIQCQFGDWDITCYMLNISRSLV